MTPTGHKGISVRYLHGEFAGLNVVVRWKGTTKATVISCQSLEDGLARAIETRDRFEKQLGKPRTEVNIRHGRGAPYVKKGYVVLYLGAKVRRWSVAKHGVREALRLARQAREEWLET